LQVTQLGHVKDLATAFVKILGNSAASKQTYNISGERFVTFDGLVKACALAAGAPEPELVHFDPKVIDLGKAKAFPLRDQHFFTSIEKVASGPPLTFSQAPYVYVRFCYHVFFGGCQALQVRQMKVLLPTTTPSCNEHLGTRRMIQNWFVEMTFMKKLTRQQVYPSTILTTG